MYYYIFYLFFFVGNVLQQFYKRGSIVLISSIHLFKSGKEQSCVTWKFIPCSSAGMNVKNKSFSLMANRSRAQGCGFRTEYERSSEWQRLSFYWESWKCTFLSFCFYLSVLISVFGIWYIPLQRVCCSQLRQLHDQTGLSCLLYQSYRPRSFISSSGSCTTSTAFPPITTVSAGTGKYRSYMFSRRFIRYT